jgi:hypothetical protein
LIKSVTELESLPSSILLNSHLMLSETRLESVSHSKLLTRLVLMSMLNYTRYLA